MNQPLIDAYLDELLGPAPREPAQAAPAVEPLADDEAVHAAVADAVTDATHDALAVALLEDYDRPASPSATDADAGVADAIATTDVDDGVHVAACAQDDVSAPAAAADAPADACVIAEESMLDNARVAPTPAFDADALAADLLAEFDREAAAMAKPAAPAPKPVVDEDLAAALLAEFDQEFAAPASAAKPPVAKAPAATPPAPAPAPAPAEPEPVARSSAPKRFELPESFAPVPPTRRIDAPAPALRPKGDSRPGQARTGRWLRVCVDADRYAVELLSVQEVVRVAPIVSMRGADSAVLGVMNLRGRIVPVYDLGLWLGTCAVRPGEDSRIVVVERNDELIGLLVTAVQDVVTLAEVHIEPPLGAGIRGAIVGVARVNDAPTVLLDANWLFD
ncbi:chemotaxis protein CheW [Cognatilysobacter bugurensis]|uniref:Chemotaxis protein CheW n=1 Tax=Cognatilysobacter bugurensis TaxID=543356 RepID=A0A918T4U7_9GAMM|nr:chemotaxis protein CheW [Lysobacter bugurensis]GHA90340.1 hypothetical protein GCM10007067_30170 [Lysobacter bugurensis]